MMNISGSKVSSASDTAYSRESSQLIDSAKELSEKNDVNNDSQVVNSVAVDHVKQQDAFEKSAPPVKTILPPVEAGVKVMLFAEKPVVEPLVYAKPTQQLQFDQVSADQSAADQNVVYQQNQLDTSRVAFDSDRTVPSYVSMPPEELNAHNIRIKVPTQSEEFSPSESSVAVAVQQSQSKKALFDEQSNEQSNKGDERIISGEVEPVSLLDDARKQQLEDVDTTDNVEQHAQFFKQESMHLKETRQEETRQEDVDVQSVFIKQKYVDHHDLDDSALTQYQNNSMIHSDQSHTKDDIDEHMPQFFGQKQVVSESASQLIDRELFVDDRESRLVESAQQVQLPNSDSVFVQKHIRPLSESIDTDLQSSKFQVEQLSKLTAKERIEAENERRKVENTEHADDVDHTESDEMVNEDTVERAAMLINQNAVFQQNVMLSEGQAEVYQRNLVAIDVREAQSLGGVFNALV